MSSRDRRPVIHAAAAILRRENEIVLVLEGEPGEELSWSLPGGVLEEGELATEGLQREMREETGLEITHFGRLAFVAQIDSERAEQPFGGGVHLTVWTFEVDAWVGELEPRDPDALVAEVRFLPLPEAIARLESSRTHPLTVRYLRGEIESGSLVLQRWHSDSRVEDIGLVQP